MSKDWRDRAIKDGLGWGLICTPSGECLCRYCQDKDTQKTIQQAEVLEIYQCLNCHALTGSTATPGFCLFCHGLSKNEKYNMAYLPNHPPTTEFLSNHDAPGELTMLVAVLTLARSLEGIIIHSGICPPVRDWYVFRHRSGYFQKLGASLPSTHMTLIKFGNWWRDSDHPMKSAGDDLMTISDIYRLESPDKVRH